MTRSAWTILVLALAACGSAPVPHRPMGQRTLLEYRPVTATPGIAGVQPTAGGAGRAPVRGIALQRVYLDEIRGPSQPFEMDVRSWSEYFRDALVREVARAGISTTTGPQVHVEVRSLEVDRPIVLGATSCHLVADVVVQQRRVPVRAPGRAEKAHTCIGNAFAALVRHVVAAPWLAPQSADPITIAIDRAKPLPDTDGRYGLQLGAQVGAGTVRTRGAIGSSTELAASYGLVLDLGLRQDWFFTGSVHGEVGSSAAIGVGFSHYARHSVLISASFLAGGGSKGTALEVPALGGQLLLGKQFKVSPSLWLGLAARPFALWSLDDGRAYGLSLLSTVTIN